MVPKSLTTVTPLSKAIAMVLFVAFPLIAFFLGVRYRDLLDRINLRAPQDTDATDRTPVSGEYGTTWEVNGVTYTVKRAPVKNDDPSSYSYELWKSGKDTPEQKIYSVVNRNGFDYDISEDGSLAAILIFGNSMGDETFSVVRTDGTPVKDYGTLDARQSLHPVMWTEHYFWLIEGVPIDTPGSVLRVNADTGKVDRFRLSSD